MKHQFLSDDPEAARWRQRAIRGPDQSLRRLRSLVERARTQLMGYRAAAGGGDKRCRVELQMRGADLDVFSAAARTWQASLEAVLSRLRQRVAA